MRRLSDYSYNLFFVFTLISLIVSCDQSPKRKAETSIKKYLTEHMHDPRSYEPVSFEKIDSNFSSFSDTERYKQLDQLYKASRFNTNSAVPLEKRMAEMDSLRNLIEKERSAFKGKFEGFTIVHNFRAKNKMGALILTSQEFKLDPQFKITKMKEVGDTD